MADFVDRRINRDLVEGTMIVTAVSTVTSNACLAKIADTQFTVRVVAGLTVAVGDLLLVVRHGSTRWAISKVAAAPAVPPASPPPPETPPAPPPPPPPDINPQPTLPPPKPVVTTGSLICPAIQTATFRNGAWRSDGNPVNSFDLFQGRFASSAFGVNTGCAFYGSKPRTLAGATITKATVRLWRLRAGSFAPTQCSLRLLTESTRPAGVATVNESIFGPALAVGDQSTFTLPASWGQSIVDGSRGGIGIFVNADSPYMQFAGRGTWSVAFSLTLYWRRG